MLIMYFIKTDARSHDLKNQTERRENTARWRGRAGLGGREKFRISRKKEKIREERGMEVENREGEEGTGSWRLSDTFPLTSSNVA